LFAVNAAGRARWGNFPDIISDDTYVRLHFNPTERRLVQANYEWPLVEGIHALIHVRGRQDRGVREIYSRYPELAINTNEKQATGWLVCRLALQDPVGMVVYLCVAGAARLTRDSAWSRGR
ncbi:MAG: glycosyl transferase, partial [Planctomycetota bacterium]